MINYLIITFYDFFHQIHQKFLVNSDLHVILITHTSTLLVQCILLIFLISQSKSVKEIVLLISYMQSVQFKSRLYSNKRRHYLLKTFSPMLFKFRSSIKPGHYCFYDFSCCSVIMDWSQWNLAEGIQQKQCSRNCELFVKWNIPKELKIKNIKSGSMIITDFNLFE